jgi:hypothetical protein
MICATTLKTKPIPTCLGELTIGVIADVSTAVNVHLHDVTTGRTEIFQETSDGAGIVKVDLTDKDFSDNHSYQIWITAAASSVKTTITIGSKSSEIVELNFQYSKDGDSVFIEPQVTLEEE